MTDGRAQLSGPATPAAARIALDLLDAAHAAEQRLRDGNDGTDSEALHDFRVALRRLRTILRSFRSALDEAVPNKLRNGLRDLARATAAGRDAEVLETWTEACGTSIPAGKRGGVPWFRAQLVQRRVRAYRDIRADVVQDFRKLERRLRKALAIATKRGGAARSQTPTFGTALASLITEYAAVLAEELAAFQSAGDDTAGHAARITAKRLRYLLEPLGEFEPRAAEIVARLKQLQTLLGEIHDLGLLAAELVDAVGTAAAERARGQHDRALGAAGPTETAGGRSPRPATAGLMALARAVRDARDERFRRFTAEWRGAPLNELLSDCAALASTLATFAPPLPDARERSAPLQRHPRPPVT